MTILEQKLKEKKITAYTLAGTISPSGIRSASFIRKKIRGRIAMKLDDLQDICQFAGIDIKEIPYDTVRLKVI